MATRILVCDDEAGLREMLGVLFRRAGFSVELADGVANALKRIAEDPPYDVVVTDLIMPGGSGMQVLEAARTRDESTQVVMITAYATTEQAVEAMRKGAYDYVQKPFRNDELRATVDKALEKHSILAQNRELREQLTGTYRRGDLVGKSAAIQQVMDLIDRVGAARTSVLITGESGTGKEVIARSLHRQSDRADKAYIVVNCGAIPETLIESELFGHEKGAFTGATGKKDGLFRAAEGGTIFLDEIAELPMPMQVKLLRVLQERSVRPVGANKELEVDVRVVAATNRNLEQEVAQGRFRQDLFYRLNVIRIEVPPLRERREDIPLLAEHFLKKHSALQDKRLTLDTDALRALAQLDFPGNVRELENTIERAVTLARGDRIVASDLPSTAQKLPPSVAPVTFAAAPAFGEGFDLDGYLGEVERKILLDALSRAGGVRTNAAKLLGMSFRSFRYRLAKYGLGADEDGTE